MTRRELEDLVKDGESAQLEFKKSTGQRDAATRTVCAMLNSKGGTVIFGVDDRGSIVGQQISTKTVADVVAELKHIEPSVALDPVSVPLTGTQSALVLFVPRGGQSPYIYKRQPFERRGPTTSAMPQSRYEQLLTERMHASQRWELMPAQHLGVRDLDHAEITRTVDEAVRRGRMNEPGTREPEALLQGMKLIRDSRLLNAGVALFGRSADLLPDFTQCVLRLARFRGNTKTAFDDNRQVYGNAFRLLEEAQQFLRQHLPVTGRIVPNLFERIDDPLYPPEALREALANAICHRDYSTGAGSISIAIYDDRLEITSIGHLPFGQTPADLLRPHQSQPWNPLIAGVFYRRGLIENWGRGTLRMIELTEAAGLPAPEFEVQAGAVTVRFRPSRYVAPSREEYKWNTT